MKRTCLAASMLALSLATLAVGAPEPRGSMAAAPATVAMTLDHGRLTIPIDLRSAGGVTYHARAWLDTGGTDLVLAEPLARALGVDISRIGEAIESSVLTQTAAPTISVAGTPVNTEGMVVSVRAGKYALQGVEAECILPARCLLGLHVVFDYPARKLAVGAPGAFTPRGASVPCRVNPTTGLFMVTATIDGESVPLGVDTGSAGTWISDKLTSAWLAGHQDWPRAKGAAGSTNFFGFPFETKGTLLRLPQLTIGSATSEDVAVLGLPQQLFDWYSKKSATAVAGFVGAEFLTRFRLEVDFPSQTCWWQAGPVRQVRDLDIVGLTLRPEMDRTFTIAGMVTRNGRPLVEGVEPGDKLVRVGALATQNARMGEVVDALRGRPGETRTLVLERAGRTVTVTALVVRLP